MKAWRTVFWAFLGVRKGTDLETDAARLSPAQVILAGLAGALLLVLGLLGLVLFITR